MTGRLWLPAAPRIIPIRERDLDRHLCSMFGVNHLNGFNVAQGAVGTWQTAWSETVSVESGSTFAGYTLVQVIPSSKITLTGGTQVRVRFKSGSGGYAITKCYIGEGASSGDAYDFATTPTQLTFSGGSAGFTIGASTTIKSDDGISFSIPSGKNICVSWYEATGYPQMYANPGGYTAGWNYVAGDSAATVDKTGMTKYQDVGGIDLMEILA